MPNALERNARQTKKAEASPSMTDAIKKANPNDFATSLKDYDRKKAKAEEPEGLQVKNPAPTPAQAARKGADEKRQAESEASKKAQAEEKPKEPVKASGSPQEPSKAPEATPVAPKASGSTQEPAKGPESTPTKAVATPAPRANLLDDESRENLALLLEAAQAEKDAIKQQNDELLKLLDSQYAAQELTQKNIVRLEVAKAINVATLTLLKKLHDATK